MYFQKKLLALAFGKPQNLHVTARCFGRDASTVALDNITKGNENSFHFNVTSRTNKSLTYQVDTSLGTCTCPKGENGSGCAHSLKKGVLIFVQILTHLLVGFVTHLKVC